VMNNYSGTVGGMLVPGGQPSPFVSPLPVPAPFQSPLPPPSTSSLPPSGATAPLFDPSLLRIDLPASNSILTLSCSLRACYLLPQPMSSLDTNSPPLVVAHAIIAVFQVVHALLEKTDVALRVSVLRHIRIRDFRAMGIVSQPHG